MNALDVEVALIQNPDVKIFVRKALDMAPARFWTDGSSASGKHHAEDECCEGGLVLHTRRVVAACRVLAPAYGVAVGSWDMDVAIAACILHDVVKYGTKPGPGYDFAAYKRHGPNVGLWYSEVTNRLPDFFTDAETAVFELTRSHMGPWSPEGYYPENPLQWLVFMSDYVASRKAWAGVML
jgi:hypothetical protein